MSVNMILRTDSEEEDSRYFFNIGNVKKIGNWFARNCKKDENIKDYYSYKLTEHDLSEFIDYCYAALYNLEFKPFNNVIAYRKTEDNGTQIMMCDGLLVEENDDCYARIRIDDDNNYYYIKDDEYDFFSILTAMYGASNALRCVNKENVYFEVC